MKRKSKIRVLTLEGPPKNRGMYHGELLESAILEVLERYKYRITGQNHDEIIDTLFAETNFFSTAKKWTPQLIEEIDGIAIGVGVDFKEVFAMNLLAHDEIFWLKERSESQEHCTSIGCFKEGDRPALLGQNLDLSNIFEGLEVLLHIKNPNSSIESYVISHAGFLGECGVNNQPVGVCCNCLTDYLNCSANGLPFGFIIRLILEQSSLKEAAELVRKIPHASSQNYMIGGSERVISLECSANKVDQFVPNNNSGRIYHTNHPLVNDDTKVESNKPKGNPTTHHRYKYVKARLDDPSKHITLATFKYILSSHFGPVCVHHDNKPTSEYTFTSAIYELTTPPVLHLTVGPPCLSEYEIITF